MSLKIAMFFKILINIQILTIFQRLKFVFVKFHP